MMVWAFGLLMPMIIAAIIWIAGDVIGVFFPSGVGNIAHLSGVAIGFLAGLTNRIINRYWLFKNKKEKVSISEDYIKNWEDNYMK